MKKLLKQIFLLLISSIFFFNLLLFAQNNNKHDVSISEEHYQILERRKELIKKDVALNKNEWSGTYQFGDHHPTIFMWSEKEGFLTWGSNHTFAPSRINFGKAEILNNRLIIKPEINKDHLNFQYIPTELELIKWGEQHFLIPPNRLMDFAYAVHSGSELQIGEYLIKSEDYQKSQKGLPNLPKEYEKFLLMKAIKPKIAAVKIDEEDIFDSVITLNLGRADKLIEGMIFYNISAEGSVKIMITDLQEKTSKARVIGIIGNGVDKTPVLKIGLRFTSKMPKNFDDI